jgi:hypothetical protein
MIDLQSVDPHSITLTNFRVVQNGVTREACRVFDISFDNKYIVVPKRSCIFRPKQDKEYVRIDFNEEIIVSCENIVEFLQYNPLLQDGKYLYKRPRRLRSPFSVIVIRSIKFLPETELLRQSFNVYAVKVKFDICSAKNIAQKQFIILYNVFPMEVRCNILERYLALL